MLFTSHVTNGITHDQLVHGVLYAGEYWAQSHELCLPAAGAEDGHVNHAGKTKFRARRLGLCFFVWCKLYAGSTASRMMRTPVCTETQLRCVHVCNVLSRCTCSNVR